MMTVGLLRRLACCAAGSMAVETAIIAPVLGLLGLGGFQVSSMVARQSELDGAMAEAAAVVRTSPPVDAAGRETIRAIVQTSIDPNNTNPNDVVAISEIYRCATDDYVTVKATCATGKALSTYVKLVITDEYDPIWTSFGVAGPVQFRVERKIQVS
jgi:Flp pilus assembly protein TadG